MAALMKGMNKFLDPMWNWAAKRYQAMVAVDLKKYGEYNADRLSVFVEGSLNGSGSFTGISGLRHHNYNTNVSTEKFFSISRHNCNHKLLMFPSVMAIKQSAHNTS